MIDFHIVGQRGKNHKVEGLTNGKKGLGEKRGGRGMGELKG